MGKNATEIFRPDPWRIIEEGFEPGRNRVCESVFSIANEYMGVRGYCEESTGVDSLRGSYCNGIYDYAEHINHTIYKGIVQRTHYMVTAPDWLYLRFSLDGEAFDMGDARVEAHTRALDLRDGSLTREFVWNTRSGRRLSVKLERFVCMDRVEHAYQRLTVTPLGFDGALDVTMAVDFGTIHRNSGLCHWNLHRTHAGGDFFAGIGETLNTSQRIFAGFTLAGGAAEIGPFAQGTLCSARFVLPLRDGTPSAVEKRIAVAADRGGAADDEVWARGEALLRANTTGFDDALRENAAHWARLWERHDVRIDGDLKNQQGIRFCIFQLHQTYQGHDEASNIGAKGLTGESYNGHAFWDTETYCLPFFLFGDTRAARNLLEFRYKTLPQAKARAKELDCEGACYPVATLNGSEACDLWQHASLQFQSSTGVAYGIRHYMRVCDDRDFLYGHGAEMLVEISRFLRARGSWNGDGTKFGFYAVMGPDEFHMMVEHNCYTNLMAKKTFEYTLEVVEEMRRRAPEAYAALMEKTGLAEPELAAFSQCAERMYILYDDKTGLFEQHRGYFDLPHVDVDKIPVEDFPLYYHWSYDRIYRTDMIKQPDVLMFLFLHNTDFTERQKRANYEYYEPRCIHESSLSPSIHSVFAAELGMPDEAFRFFGFATRMDLDDYNRNACEGLHTTSLAAAWVNIVYGFGGLRSDGDTLRLAPTIPAQWSGYSFRLCYRGAVLRIDVTRERGDAAKIEGPAVAFDLYGVPVVLADAPVSIPLGGAPDAQDVSA